MINKQKMDSSTNERLLILEEALLKTRQFDSLIRNEDWDELKEQTEQRQKILELFFTNEVSDEDKTKVAQIIEEIIKLDESYKSTILEKKTLSIKETVGIKNKLKAAKAYQIINDRQ
ncbi:flagellar protein FliT [Aliikangiella sp. G2MR2-5]|uniref:flagellar protein FliT n=1 Tax=Aliikangiella sp. G2MR2-5 TaxID=2788943 RepID=UPI0018A9205F|nr:flagellar protein FliT [Aliikangiella sp. G2MR2-5]